MNLKLPYCYLVVTADEYELPCGCFDTCNDVAHFLMCQRSYVGFLIRWGTAYKSKYKVLKINLK